MLELSFGKAKTGFRNAVRIVFVTSLISYAVAWYSVEAFDYVVKPVSYSRFASLPERVFRAADREGSGDISKAEFSGTAEKGVDDDGDLRATLTISSCVYKWQDGSDITGDDYEAAGMTGTHTYE